MKKLTIIKIGGKVIDDEVALDQFLKDFSEIEGAKILVHGGGKIASDFGERLGIKPQLIDGRRITDKATLELVTMVYGGLVNKKIVAKLQSQNENAIGLTGADANVLSAIKRSVKTVDYGFAGDVTKAHVNTESLSKLLSTGLTPVFCALTHDGKGQLLNTNADTIASILSAALSAFYEVDLVYCFEQKGVLSDFENQIVIKEIGMSTYQKLRQDGTINEGMIPKMDNAFDALYSGVLSVRIGHFSDVRELINGKEGTLINLDL